MTCEIDKRDDGYHVRGEMTIYNAVELKKSLFPALTDLAGPHCIDLAEVSEFDTAGLQLLLMAERECVERGQGFSVQNPSPAVRQALDLLRPHGLGSSGLGNLGQNGASA
jgi:anti-anti-sigma factor